MDFLKSGLRTSGSVHRGKGQRSWPGSTPGGGPTSHWHRQTHRRIYGYESGKRHENRPQLLAALRKCRKAKATLVIAKLDRLGRNVAFISALMESGVAFVGCDNPHANKLMLHMLAAFAEHERELISGRAKECLAAKARGARLGNPRLHEARARAAEVIRNKADPESTISLMLVSRCHYVVDLSALRRFLTSESETRRFVTKPSNP